MKNNRIQFAALAVLLLGLGYVFGRLMAESDQGDKQVKKRIIKKQVDDSEELDWGDDDTKVFITEEEDSLTVMVEALESSGFEGDTLINGANISIRRAGDEVRVEVKKEMNTGEGSHTRKEVKKIIERQVED